MPISCRSIDGLITSAAWEESNNLTPPCTVGLLSGETETERLVRVQSRGESLSAMCGCQGVQLAR